jgi:hypothetical protein
MKTPNTCMRHTYCQHCFKARYTSFFKCWYNTWKFCNEHHDKLLRINIRENKHLMNIVCQWCWGLGAVRLPPSVICTMSVQPHWSSEPPSRPRHNPHALNNIAQNNPKLLSLYAMAGIYHGSNLSLAQLLYALNRKLDAEANYQRCELASHTTSSTCLAAWLTPCSVFERTSTCRRLDIFCDFNRSALSRSFPGSRVRIKCRTRALRYTFSKKCA